MYSGQLVIGNYTITFEALSKRAMLMLAVKHQADRIELSDGTVLVPC